jgi:hypothetical protein
MRRFTDSEEVLVVLLFYWAFLVHPKMKSPTMSDGHTDGIPLMTGHPPAEDLGVQFPNYDNLIYFEPFNSPLSLVLGELGPGISFGGSLKFINDRGRAWVTNRGWSSSLISKIRLFARSWISRFQFSKAYNLVNHVSHNKLWSNFCLKKWEELIYCGKSWNIGQVCFECLMFMNFVALLRKICTAFLFNEAVSTERLLNYPV